MALQFEEQRVAFSGKLGGSTLREARQLVKELGGIVADPSAEDLDCLILGEAELPLSVSESQLDASLSRAAATGQLRVLSETEFWRAVGRIESAPSQQRYTPAMLADLLGVSVAVIRRWHRRGLLEPVEVVHRLPYFDFTQVVTARQLAKMLAEGMSPAMLERKLQSLVNYLPAARRSLAQLSVIVEGGELLLRRESGLLGSDGQMRFDFQTSETEAEQDSEETPAVLGKVVQEIPAIEGDVEQLRQRALELEEQNELAAAVNWYRAALAVAGPQAELCFQLAEALYRLGEVTAARERYFMAVELDSDFVEARANLGCVLAETLEWDLAVAAFEGALETHPNYADVHFHLAAALEQLGRSEEAVDHWRKFLELVPEGPWSDEARRKMEFLSAQLELS